VTESGTEECSAKRLATNQSRTFFARRSVDNVNSSLVLCNKSSDYGGIDFLFLEATTYERYESEVAFGLGQGEKPPKSKGGASVGVGGGKKRKKEGQQEDAGAGAGAEETAEENNDVGLSNVLKSLAPRHASMLKLLAREQLKYQNSEKSDTSGLEIGKGAVAYRLFREMCSKVSERTSGKRLQPPTSTTKLAHSILSLRSAQEMLCSDDRALRIMMSELDEHDLLSTGSMNEGGAAKRSKNRENYNNGGGVGGGGGEVVFIPHSKNVLMEICRWES